MRIELEDNTNWDNCLLGRKIKIKQIVELNAKLTRNAKNQFA